MGSPTFITLGDVLGYTEFINLDHGDEIAWENPDTGRLIYLECRGWTADGHLLIVPSNRFSHSEFQDESITCPTKLLHTQGKIYRLPA
jgi:hypothetical protein